MASSSLSQDRVNKAPYPGIRVIASPFERARPIMRAILSILFEVIPFPGHALFNKLANIGLVQIAALAALNGRLMTSIDYPLVGPAAACQANCRNRRK